MNSKRLIQIVLKWDGGVIPGKSNILEWISILRAGNVTRKIFFAIAIYSIFGCSATQQLVPNRPLGKGGTEFSVTLGISTSNFSRVSLQ
jgi:hypothetical protein